MNSKIMLVLAFLALLIPAFSFVTSDGYPFMGQNNEIIDSQTYISDKPIYSFDGYSNKSIKLIEDTVILSKIPKYWVSSSLALGKSEGVYQEFYIHDEDYKLWDIKKNDSSSQISISNNLKINPTVIKTTTVKEILNEDDLSLFFTLIQVGNDSFLLSLENYGNYDIESVVITYGFINELNIYFEGYNHGYYEDWKVYNIQEGDSIKTNVIANKSIKIHVKNLKIGESKLYSITKNDNKW